MPIKVELLGDDEVDTSKTPPSSGVTDNDEKKKYEERNSLLGRLYLRIVFSATAIVGFALLLWTFIYNVTALNVSSFTTTTVRGAYTPTHALEGSYGTALAALAGTLGAAAITSRKRFAKSGGSVAVVLVVCAACAFVAIVYVASLNTLNDLVAVYTARNSLYSLVSEDDALGDVASSSVGWDVQLAAAHVLTPSTMKSLAAAGAWFTAAFAAASGVSLAVYYWSAYQKKTRAAVFQDSSNKTLGGLLAVAALADLVFVAITFWLAYLARNDGDIVMIYRHVPKAFIATFFSAWVFYLAVSASFWFQRPDSLAGAYVRRGVLVAVTVLVGVLALASLIWVTVLAYDGDNCAVALSEHTSETQRLVCNVHCEQTYALCASGGSGGDVPHEGKRLMSHVFFILRCVAVFAQLTLLVVSLGATAYAEKKRNKA